MTNTFGRIVKYMSQPEPDGAVLVQVADVEGDPFDLRIEPQDVPKLLGVLQRAMMQMAQGSDRDLMFQEATIEHIQLGFGGGEVAILVSTDEIGTIALQGTEDAFRALGVTSAQAMEFLSGDPH